MGAWARRAPPAVCLVSMASASTPATWSTLPTGCRAASAAAETAAATSSRTAVSHALASQGTPLPRSVPGEPRPVRDSTQTVPSPALVIQRAASPPSAPLPPVTT